MHDHYCHHYYRSSLLIINIGRWGAESHLLSKYPKYPKCQPARAVKAATSVFLSWPGDVMRWLQTKDFVTYIYICIYIWLLVLYSYRIFIPIHELILPVDHRLQPQEALSIFDIWDTKNNSINRSCLRLDATQMFGDTNFPFRFLAVFKKQGEPPCDQHLIIQKVPRWLITEKMSASMGPTSDRPWSSSLIHH